MPASKTANSIITRSMMTFLLLILSGLAFAIGLHFEMREVSIAAIQIFAVFVFCCLIDSVFGLLALRRTAGRRSVRLGVLHPLTWVGRHFAGYQEAISYRINSLSNQIDTSITQQAVEAPKPTAESEQSFFEQTLHELESSFKPISSAVMVQGELSDPMKVMLKGLRGKRLEEQLKHIFGTWFTNAEAKWLGSKDTIHHDFPSEELSGLGIRYIVSSSFKRSDIKGILFLGFGSDKEPSATVLSRLEDFAKKLERELSTLASFQQLRSQVDQAEKVSEARSEFLTHISHDIKSPLNNVRAVLTLLRKDLQEIGDSKQLVEVALRNCDSVAELVDSLTDFAKHRAGKLAANKTVFNLADLVEEAVHSFEVSAKAKGLALSFISPVCDVQCFADKTQIRRIINNLLSNSVKYTQVGKISVGIKAHDEHTWLVRISDTGSGFSEQQLKEIFTPFTRFDKQRAEGVGLGLAVSKILAEINGGSLQVRSEYEMGSVFGISVPANIQAARSESTKLDNIVDFSSATPSSIKVKEISRLAGLRLLVVDDDADATQALARILASEGADVAQANTVPDAMSIINFDQPDVLITDAKMPDGGGIKLLKYVKLNRAGTAVVVVTGDDSKADEFIALGAVCVMDKPVHIAELFDYLEDILRSRQQMVVGLNAQ